MLSRSLLLTTDVAICRKQTTKLVEVFYMKLDIFCQLVDEHSD